ncbi:hypothetical protein, partial [Roseisolibacter sp. H3M3-2]|uniref:hypothetical protein n=1 Tax=Roseisolibacter sp. H3M3-2 TaxID=3031323 RepID=UPI0023DA4B51
APLASVPTLPDGSRRVDGRVVLVRDTVMRPVAGTWVTLHRVGSDSAGALDSLRTGADGGYRFRYRPFGADDALYFASTSHGGIAYFTSPLRLADVRGDEGEIAVFDTTSRALPISVRGRHLIVPAPDAEGRRRVIEVFELTNDTSLTAVPGSDGARGAWSAALPAAARDFAVRPGEIPADGMAAIRGRALLLAPFAPGIKQVAYTYTLDGDAFPLAVALERATTVLEVLIEDPRGAAVAPGLTAVEPVSLEGRTFRRFLAQEVPAGSRVEVTVPATARGWERIALPALLSVVGGVMHLALLRALRLTAPAAAPAGATASRVAPAAAP